MVARVAGAPVRKKNPFKQVALATGAGKGAGGPVTYGPKGRDMTEQQATGGTTGSEDLGQAMQATKILRGFAPQYGWRLVGRQQ